MAYVVDDDILETSAVTGTGTPTTLGAVSGFKALASALRMDGTAIQVGDLFPYSIFGVDASGNRTGEWEAGIGTLASSTTFTRTALRSSNANALVVFSAGTKYIAVSAIASRMPHFDNEGAVQMPIVPSSPSTPAADTLAFYARKVAGRIVPKWKPPSGVDNVMQPALFGNRIVTFNPNTGTVGTGQGLGPAWTSNGTVTHPTPATTAPAVSNQMKRTRYANIVTTTNQQLGPRFNVASEQQFWRGNAAGLGGFFMQARFIVELYPASTVRIFAGLSATASGSVAISDTVLANTCGLWHDTTDPSSGANSFNFVTKDATTANKQSIALSNAIAAGNSYDWYMYAKPNDTAIYWQLEDIVNNVVYTGSSSTNLPVNTAFMQPQVQMSNGTANVTVTTVAIGVAGIYVESDR